MAHGHMAFCRGRKTQPSCKTLHHKAVGWKSSESCQCVACQEQDLRQFFTLHYLIGRSFCDISCSYTSLCQEKRFPSRCLAGSWLWQQGQTRKGDFGPKLLLDRQTPGLGITKVANFCFDEVHLLYENFLEATSHFKSEFHSHLQTFKHNMLLTTRKSSGMVYMNFEVTNSSHLLTSFNLARVPYFKSSSLSELSTGTRSCLVWPHTPTKILFHQRPFPLLLPAPLPVHKYSFSSRFWPTLKTAYSSVFKIVIMIFSHFVSMIFCYNDLLFSKLLQCRLQTTQTPLRPAPFKSNSWA